MNKFNSDETRLQHSK